MVIRDALRPEEASLCLIFCCMGISLHLTHTHTVMKVWNVWFKGFSVFETNQM